MDISGTIVFKVKSHSGDASITILYDVGYDHLEIRSNDSDKRDPIFYVDQLKNVIKLVDAINGIRVDERKEE